MWIKRKGAFDNKPLLLLQKGIVLRKIKIIDLYNSAILFIPFSKTEKIKQEKRSVGIVPSDRFSLYTKLLISKTL